MWLTSILLGGSYLMRVVPWNEAKETWKDLPWLLFGIEYHHLVLFKEELHSREFYLIQACCPKQSNSRFFLFCQEIFKTFFTQPSTGKKLEPPHGYENWTLIWTEDDTEICTFCLVEILFHSLQVVLFSNFNLIT